MITIQQFTFNPFQENTYVLSDDTKECVIIDPGCSQTAEQEQLSAYITNNNLKPVRLLNTHCHIDHICGNAYVAKQYNLPLEANQGDAFLIEALPDISKMYGFPAEESPEIGRIINEDDSVTFGNSTLEAIHVPGHSPGSIVFYNKEQGFMVVGDVLFQGSIGRSDLPGGNHEQLIQNIQSKLLTKADETVVYSGHGAPTTIGNEKANNPFLK